MDFRDPFLGLGPFHVVLWLTKKKKKKKPESDRGIYFVLLPPHPLALVASSLMSLTSEIYPLSLSHSHGRQQKSASPAQVPEKRNASSVK